MDAKELATFFERFGVVTEAKFVCYVRDECQLCNSRCDVKPGVIEYSYRALTMISKKIWN